MFTGIIESVGIIHQISRQGSNVSFEISSELSAHLSIDQSIAHNGVCLTVVELSGSTYCVTAVEETLQRSNLGQLQPGSLINLERAMGAHARLDGHIVQGHVDTTGHCIGIEDKNGSWNFRFQFPDSNAHLLVDKGSICVNGVSLTVVNPTEDQFSVAIIPYTFHHTTFKTMQIGDTINLEFDILGKYIARYAKLYLNHA
ncbi:MAG TPA: riboflavin synthase [Saprospiraceae bacterium]|nr:riboflavin synthase [Saprospiraceae bacterium]HMQ83970.1 riboflavin synthase [Saprospiraceae bacterium]